MGGPRSELAILNWSSSFWFLFFVLLWSISTLIGCQIRHKQIWQLGGCFSEPVEQFLNFGLCFDFHSSNLIGCRTMTWTGLSPTWSKNVVKFTIPLSKRCRSCVIRPAPSPPEVRSHVLNVRPTEIPQCGHFSTPSCMPRLCGFF